jgi:hypothetical protein
VIAVEDAKAASSKASKQANGPANGKARAATAALKAKGVSASKPSKEAKAAADSATNRAVIAGLAEGVAEAGGAAAEMLSAAGPRAESVLLLAIRAAVRSGNDGGHARWPPGSIRGPVADHVRFLIDWEAALCAPLGSSPDR